MRRPRPWAMRHASPSSSRVSWAPSSRALKRSSAEVDGVRAVGDGGAHGVERAGGCEKLGDGVVWHSR